MSPLVALAVALFTAAPAPAAPPPAATAAPKLDLLTREQFNFRAQDLFEPLFWRADANGNKAIDPDEVAFLWGPHGTKREDYVDGKGFTARFLAAYAQAAKKPDLASLPPAEQKRRELVLLELSQGRPTLIETDFSSASKEDLAMVEHVFKAAVLLERIHAKQLGTDALAAKIPTDDTASQSLFHRNQGPHCAAPKTESNELCSALAEKPKKVSGLYPADLQSDPKFCAVLEKEKNAKALMGHFSVVVRDGKGFKAVPYSEAYKEEMQAIAKELDLAAAALPKDEAAFKAYLTANAKAFRTNDWEPANAAWVAMGPKNSKWYLRLAPDEVYYEPCAWKAGFATNFSRINLASLEWQRKLEPVKGDMEKALAVLAGPPYKARDVKFKLPDFIDVMLNAGDQRNAHGATIGQSLPNWGPVAEKGGRTVAMTNLYTDPDSRKQLEAQMASLYCKATNALASSDPKPAVMSTVLHEAAHNLGPAHDYKVDGKEDDVVFGGPLASTMEELKAQTAALYFAEWLVGKSVISADEARAAHVRDIAWAFGHISRGMYDGSGDKPKTYSQLASIQLGTLFKAGALVWKSTEAPAAGGSDVGCFELDFAKWTPTLDALAKRVLMTKGKGDKAEAEKMKAELVDAKDEWEKARAVITERWLRAPKATFVYSVKQ